MSDPKDAVYVAPERDLGEDATRDAEGDAPDVERPDAGPDGEDEEDAGGCLGIADCPMNLGPNVEVACVQGQCQIRCVTGYFDLNGDLEDSEAQEKDGCECQQAEEVCDGVDNDCDGITDEDEPDLVTFCENQNGLCDGASLNRCTFDGTSYITRACTDEEYISHNEKIDISDDFFEWSCEEDQNCNAQQENCCENNESFALVIDAMSSSQNQIYPSVALPTRGWSKQDQPMALIAWREANDAHIHNFLEPTVLRWVFGVPGADMLIDDIYSSSGIQLGPFALWMNERYWLISAKRTGMNEIDFVARVYNANQNIQRTQDSMENWPLHQSSAPFNSIGDLQVQAAESGDELILLWTFEYPNGANPCTTINNQGSCIVLQRISVDVTNSTTNARPPESPSALEEISASSQSRAPAMAQRGDAGIVAWLRIGSEGEGGETALQWRAWSRDAGELVWSERGQRALAAMDATVRPAVARWGAGYLLLWEQANGGGAARALMAQELTAAGVEQGSPVTLDTALSLHSVKAIAQEDGAVVLLYVKENMLHYAKLSGGEALGMLEARPLSTNLSPSAGASWAHPTAEGGLALSASDKEESPNSRYKLRTSLWNAEGAQMCLEGLP